MEVLRRFVAPAAGLLLLQLCVAGDQRGYPGLMCHSDEELTS
ncbi:exported protein of unknown function [Candidatus Filomicrobium marinum]|uniref:Uncharacterized protein n=1 Tax=Candidatus Filomicrobium marinum TaxID=1608628 RepID=A0A0D6JBC4_9HYPH|nr:exported protein of unknown function [Candidatus Filomicrobium marinum]CPR15593.1 exported protein of unknown function [Candidatus Filomicrobium marinum]